jgi:hypothetical protein
MATAQRQSGKPSATPQYESIVDQELNRAQRRLRGLDVAVWALALGVGFVGYGLLVSLIDRPWHLPWGVRLAGWLCLVAAIVAWIAVGWIQLTYHRINPRFVAHQLENTIPDAKNSVINWLDLRGQALAPVIRSSLGRRAAKDIGHADPEKALSARQVWWLGGALGVVLLIQLGWLIAAPSQVWSLLRRAYFPFGESRIAARTDLTLLEPASGDVAVLPNQPVHIRVQAEGYVPPLNQKDSLKLHFHYHQSEPFEERGLVPDVDGTWTTVVHADQVRNGFWYKITGGDSRLPEDREYRVQVRPVAQVLQFKADFKYRDYLKLKDKTVVYEKNVRPTIREMRGTQATLTVRANRQLKSCALELKTGSSKKLLAGEAVPGDPEAWRFKWVLDQSGEFRVLFESKDGEANGDRDPCKIEVIPDRAPEVALTKPGKDISLPANGTLILQGYANDDFGVKSMQLRFKLLKAPTLAELQRKPYRPGKKFQLVNGKYPLRLDYSDFVALDSLQTTAKTPFPLAEGMELEYWLEARDNCDYPDKNGNLGQSARYKVIIEPPVAKSQVAKDREGAQQQTQQSQQKQDSSLNDQNMIADAENQAGGGGGGGQQQQNQQGGQDLANESQKVENAIDDANRKGEAKGSGEDKNEAKDQNLADGAGEKGNPKDNQIDKGNDPGKEKGEDKQAQAKESGQGNDKGADAGDQGKNAQGQGKDQGQPDANKQQQGASKGKDSDSKPGAEKTGQGDAKDAPKDASGGAKGKDASPKPGEILKNNASGDRPSDNVQPAPEGQKGGTPTDKAAPKNAPTTLEQMGDAKGGEQSAQPPPADAKLAPPDQKGGNGKAGDRRDATMEDVAKLREMLNDPAQRDAVKKALEKISDQANDSKVSQAAEKALDESKAQPGQARPNDLPPPQSASQSGDKEAAKTSPGKDASGNSAKGGQPKPSADKGQEEKGGGKAPPSAKDEAGKPASGNFSPQDGGTFNPGDPGNANPVDEAAARRAGELQLESLKKQIDKLRKELTPPVLEKLKWTEQDREKYLQRLLADALLRQQQQKVSGAKRPAPGSISKLLPGSGPRNLTNDPNAKDRPMLVDRPEAPPDVREALKLFERK